MTAAAAIAASPTIDLGPIVRPIAALLVVVLLARAAPVFWRVYRHRRAGLDEVDKMPGREFEHYLGLLFERLGYKVEVTKAHGDYGADLVLRKGGERLVVQAKRWSKSVGVKAIQEAVAAVPMYRADRALVVANRAFSQPAKRLAKSNRVDLWGRDELAAKIIEAQLGQPRATSGSASSEASEAFGAVEPKCQRCGSPMVLRSGQRGQFYGCSTFPRCRFTLPAPADA